LRGDTSAPAAAAKSVSKPFPPGAIALIVTYGLIGFGYSIPGTFLPLIARQLLQRPDIADAIWPLYGIAAVVVTIALPFLAARLRSGNRALLIGCLLAMMIGCGACLVSASIAGVLVAAILNGGVLMAVVLLTMREAHRIAPTHATLLMASLTSVFGLGQIVGPFCAGYAAHASGNFRGALLIAVAAFALGIVVTLSSLRNPRATSGAGE
jgi:cyanate permease